MPNVGLLADAELVSSGFTDSHATVFAAAHMLDKRRTRTCSDGDDVGRLDR